MSNQLSFVLTLEDSALVIRDWDSSYWLSPEEKELPNGPDSGTEFGFFSRSPCGCAESTLCSFAILLFSYIFSMSLLRGIKGKIVNPMNEQTNAINFNLG